MIGADFCLAVAVVFVLFILLLRSRTPCPRCGAPDTERLIRPYRNRLCTRCGHTFGKEPPL